MRLVFCDDNRIFCEALAVALEARGHRALAIATTADESVAAVARYLPDACLLDLRFHSGGDGLGTGRLLPPEELQQLHACRSAGNQGWHFGPVAGA